LPLLRQRQRRKANRIFTGYLMGQRSGTETAIQIIQAFLRQRTWKQAELARTLDIGVPALRKRLDELTKAGVPLDTENDPPHVYWSVPKTWLPGAVRLTPEEILDLRRLLTRLPNSKSRSALLKRLSEAIGNSSPAPQTVHVARETGPQEEQFLALLEDHILQRKTLRFKYFTASRAALDWREASPYRVDIGPPIRFVAWCHRSKELRWFRLDQVQSIAPEANDKFNEDPGGVDQFIRASLDGYHDNIEPIECAFFVAETAARWVRYNLPEGFHTSDVPGGIEVTGTTAGIRPLARFIVGLGAEARTITPELIAIVTDLAQGALSAHRGSEARVKLRSVRSKRSRG
jgi:predicted DNA-binding transcriptional regulator YafY